MNIFYTLTFSALIPLLCYNYSFSKENSTQDYKTLLKEKKFSEVISVLEKKINKAEEKYFSDYFFSLISLKKYEEAIKISEKYNKKNKKPIYKVYLYVAKSYITKIKNIDSYIVDVLNKENSLELITKSFFIFEKYNLYNEALYLIALARKSKNDNSILPFKKIEVLEILDKPKEIVDEYFLIFSINLIQLDELKNKLSKLINSYSSDITEYILSKCIRLNQSENSNKKNQDLLIWANIYSNNHQDAILFASAIDNREKTGGETLYKLAGQFVEIDSIKLATDVYKKIISTYSVENSFYYHNSFLEILNLKFKLIKKEVLEEKIINEIVAEYKDFFDKNAKVYYIDSYIKYIEIIAFYQKKPNKALQMINTILSNSIGKQSYYNRLSILKGDIYLLKKDYWNSYLEFMKIIKKNKNNKWGELARYRNAMVSYFKKDYSWTIAQLKTLKGKSVSNYSNDAISFSLFLNDNLLKDSVEIMLDFFKDVDIYIFKKDYDSALIKLDTIEKKLKGYSIMDDILYKKAELNEKLKNYNEALVNYKKVYQIYSFDILADKALYKAAMINLNFLYNNTETKKLLKKLILEYKNSVFVDRAIEKLDKLETVKNN